MSSSKNFLHKGYDDNLYEHFGGWTVCYIIHRSVSAIKPTLIVIDGVDTIIERSVNTLVTSNALETSNNQVTPFIFCLCEKPNKICQCWSKRKEKPVNSIAP